MKELTNLATCVLVGLMGLSMSKFQPVNIASAAMFTTPNLEKSIPTPDTKSSLPTPKPNTDKSETVEANGNRILRLSVTVDSPTYLKVKQGDQITTGQVISDNTIERDRLTKNKKQIELQIQNLQSKNIPQPIKPHELLAGRKMPSASYSEEETAIAVAQVKLQQAQSTLHYKTPILEADNPEVSAAVDKAEGGLQNAGNKVQGQQQMLQAMQDMKMQDEVIRHEEAKLQELQNGQEQAKDELKQAQGKLATSKTEQQQQLFQLKIAVQVAQGELELAQGKLAAAKSRREMEEYSAAQQQVERQQRQTQLQQEYDRQEQTYAQSEQTKDYQLAQLKLSLTAIDDKLSEIPVIKSPKSGFIRRIRPWVGNNGKYTTTLIISANK